MSSLRTGDYVKLHPEAAKTYRVAEIKESGFESFVGMFNIYEVEDKHMGFPVGIVREEDTVKVDPPKVLPRLRDLPNNQVYVAFQNPLDYSARGGRTFKGARRDGNALIQDVCGKHALAWFEGQAEIAATWTLEIHDIDTGEKVRDVRPRG